MQWDIAGMNDCLTIKVSTNECPTNIDAEVVRKFGIDVGIFGKDFVV